MIETERFPISDMIHIRGNLSDLKRSDVTIVKNTDLSEIWQWFDATHIPDDYLFSDARVVLFGKRNDSAFAPDDRGWHVSEPRKNVGNAWHCDERICMTLHFEKYEEFIVMCRHYVHDENVVFIHKPKGRSYIGEIRSMGFKQGQFVKNGVRTFISHSIPKDYFNQLIKDRHVLDDWYWDDQLDEPIDPPKLKLPL